jgi:hypothetical protein
VNGTDDLGSEFAQVLGRLLLALSDVSPKRGDLGSSGRSGPNWAAEVQSGRATSRREALGLEVPPMLLGRADAMIE